MPSLGKELWLAGLLALMPQMTLALDFRSIAVPKAILYETPSGNAKKVALLGQYYPVEVLISDGAWLKIRDAQGNINWVESKQLSDKRTVLVTVANAEIRQKPEQNAALLATVQKNVVLGLADNKHINGWIKVQHRDGLTGYVLISSIWGVD